MKALRGLRVIGQMVAMLGAGTLCGGAAVGLLAAATTPPVWERARVARVVDGDTYDLVMGGQVVRVRLLGVDAPESTQPFGKQASDSARAVLQGLVFRVWRVKKDLYGRTLGHLVLPSPVAGRTVALDSLLVVRGWAWAYDPEHSVPQRDAQQAAARRAGRGLWKCGDTAVPPKVWRGFNAEYKRRYAGSCTW